MHSSKWFQGSTCIVEVGKGEEDGDDSRCRAQPPGTAGGTGPMGTTPPTFAKQLNSAGGADALKPGRGRRRLVCRWSRPARSEGGLTTRAGTRRHYACELGLGGSRARGVLAPRCRHNLAAAAAPSAEASACATSGCHTPLLVLHRHKAHADNGTDGVAAGPKRPTGAYLLFLRDFRRGFTEVRWHARRAAAAQVVDWATSLGRQPAGSARAAGNSACRRLK